MENKVTPRSNPADEIPVMFRKKHGTIHLGRITYFGKTMLLFNSDHLELVHGWLFMSLCFLPLNEL